MTKVSSATMRVAFVLIVLSIELAHCLCRLPVANSCRSYHRTIATRRYLQVHEADNFNRLRSTALTSVVSAKTGVSLIASVMIASIISTCGVLVPSSHAIVSTDVTIGDYDNKLLTTTRRLPSDERPKVSKSVPKLQLPSSIDLVVLPSVPTVDWNFIRTDFRLWPELVLFILWLDSLKSVRAYKGSMSESADELSNARQELDVTKSTVESLSSSLSSLQLESSALSSQVADMQLQLTEGNQTVGSLTGELSNLLSEAKAASVALEQDNAVLRRELTALRARLKTDDAVSLEINRKLQEEVDLGRARDAALIQSLKRFVTTMDLVPRGVANMILMATAPQMLDDIAASVSAKNALKSSAVESEETPVKVEVREVQKEVVVVEQVNTDAEVAEKVRAAVSSAEAIWREEQSAADGEMRKQQAAIEALQESVRALIEESSAYKADVAGLRSELQRAVDEKAVLQEEIDGISAASEISTSDAKALLESQNKRLTEQLSAFELSLGRSQEEMQSKLDAAKAMARELNNQLQARDQQYAEKEASLLEQLAKTKLEITKAKEIEPAEVQQVTVSAVTGEDPSVQQLTNEEAVPKIKAKRKSSKSKVVVVESPSSTPPSSDESVAGAVADDIALKADDTVPTPEEKPIISMMLPIEEATINEQLLADELKSFSSLFKSDASITDSKLPLELESINDELLAELQLLNEDWFLEDDDDASNEQLFAEEQSLTRSLLLTEIDHTGSSEEEDISLEEVASGDVHTEVEGGMMTTPPTDTADATEDRMALLETLRRFKPSQFKATGKKELEGYLTALGIPFSEGTLKAALISALQEALKE